MPDSLQNNEHSTPIRLTHEVEVIFHGQLNVDSNVQSVLSLITQRPDVRFGVLRLLGKEGSGNIWIKKGSVICAALVSSDQELGRSALTRLLQLKEGMYAYCQLASLPESVIQQQLSQNIMDLLVATEPEPSERRSDAVAAGTFSVEPEPTPPPPVAKGGWSATDLDNIPTPQSSGTAQPLKTPMPPKPAPAPPPMTERRTHPSGSTSKGYESKDLRQLVSGRNVAVSTKDFVKAPSGSVPTLPSKPAAPKPPIDQRKLILVSGLVFLLAGTFLAFQIINALSAKDLMQQGLDALKNSESAKAEALFTNVLKTDPSIKSAYLYRAIASCRLHKYENALEDYSHYIETNPTGVAYVGRACLHIKMKNNQLAKQDCDEALKLSSQYADAYRVRALAHLKMGDYSNCLFDSDLYLMLRAKDASQVELVDALSTRALAYLKVKKYDQAIDDYTRAIELDKQNGYLYASRAAAFQGIGNWQRALEDCNTAIPLMDAPAGVYPLRAMCYAALRQNRQSIAEFDRAIGAHPNSLELRRMRGKAKLAVGDFRGAMDDFEFVLSHNPNDRESRIRFDQAKRNLPHGISESTLRRMLADSDEPSSPSSPVSMARSGDRANSLVARGYAELRKGNNEAAISTLCAAVKANPNDASARRYLAQAYLIKGNMKSAGEQFAALASLTDLDSRELCSYASCLEQSGQLDAAVKTYRDSLAKNADQSDARCALISLYKRARQERQAYDLAAEGSARARTPQERALYANALKGSSGKASKNNDSVPAAPGEISPP